MRYEPRYEVPTIGRMLTIAETAHALGMSEKTIRNWVFLRRLKVFKLGSSIRIAESEVLQLLARSHRISGK